MTKKSPFGLYPYPSGTPSVDPDMTGDTSSDGSTMYPLILGLAAVGLIGYLYFGGK
jgi:hypothetical protein